MQKLYNVRIYCKGVHTRITNSENIIGDPKFKIKLLKIKLSLLISLLHFCIARFLTYLQFCIASHICSFCSSHHTAITKVVALLKVIAKGKEEIDTILFQSEKDMKFRCGNNYNESNQEKSQRSDTKNEAKKIKSDNFT